MAGAGSSTLYVLDSNTNAFFLVDSGAEVSLLPADQRDRARPATGPPLVAANGRPITSYARRRSTLLLDGQQFSWPFVVADTPVGVLGADFLVHHSLAVDLKRRFLFRWMPSDWSAGLVIIRGVLRPLSVQWRVNLVTPGCPFLSLLQARPALTTPTFNIVMPKHKVELHIPTVGPPVFAKARRLAPDKLAVAKKEFQTMLEMGVIRRSDSPWASPLHMVSKKDGGWRPCGDFRRLNNVTVPDKYPIPFLSDSTHFLAGCRVFSKIDLVRGYHQIPVAAEDVPKTAITTPFGSFEFVRTPFGLRNAAQAFQRLMDQVAGDLPFCFIYLDDILVASASLDEHLRHVSVLFDRLEQHGMVLNKAKCTFNVPEIEFLGHKVSSAGSTPLPVKVQAVLEFPPPATALEMWRFCGMVNFYSRFVPHLSVTMDPLFKASAGKSKRDAITWTEAMSAAFRDTKEALSSATLLVHPHPSAPTALTTDASGGGIGAVLEQFTGGSWKPLAFYSKAFKSSEFKYSAFDRELLAVHSAIRHFRYFLEGRNFTVFTDHKPLTTALLKSTDAHNPRQSRHLAAITEYTSDIRHVDGKSNVVADALSRLPAAPAAASSSPPAAFSPPAVCPVLASAAADLPSLAAAQQSDQGLLKFFNLYTGDKLRLGLVRLPDSPLLLVCEMSRSAPRPLVPDALRRRVVADLHNLAHPGVKASTSLVKERFFWPNMARDVHRFVSTCVPCQKSKVVRHTRPAVQQIPMPAARFEHVHLDLVGPLPPSNGFTHLLTIVDRFSRWPEAIPIADISTITVCRAFLFNWVSRFGLPRLITSDRGTQFTSSLWAAMSSSLGMELNTTTSFHPQSNGMVERLHRRLKEALKTRLTASDWFDQLPWVLLGLRTTVKADLDASPADFVLGAPLAVPAGGLPAISSPPPAEFIRDLRRHVAAQQPVPTAHHGPRLARPSVDLPAGTKFVFVRRDQQSPPLSPAYDGPFKVVRVTGNVVTIEKGDKTDTVSASRCKPAVLEADAPVQQPPRRGRPPRPRPPAAPSPPPARRGRPPRPRPPLHPPSPRQPSPPVSGGRPRRRPRPPERFQAG